MTTKRYYIYALMGLAVLCFLLSNCEGSEGKQATLSSQQNTADSSVGPQVVNAQKTNEMAVPDTTPAAPEVKPGSLTRKTVLDYFRELPDAYALPYTLTQKDRLWYATHKPSGQQRQAMVDIQNGYMEWSYLQDEDVSQSVQAALFRTADKSPMLAVCQTDVEKSQVAQNCFFLRPEHPQQLDWTEHTVPIITAREFFSEDTPGLESEYLEDAFPILLKLPQYGTELLVQPYLGRRFYYCGEEAAEAERQMCPLYDQLERRTFKMNWNRSTGRFE